MYVFVLEGSGLAANERTRGAFWPNTIRPGIDSAAAASTAASSLGGGCCCCWSLLQQLTTDSTAGHLSSVELLSKEPPNNLFTNPQVSCFILPVKSLRHCKVFFGPLLQAPPQYQSFFL